ncbi:transposase [Pseudomonas protegens]|uniref:transposase n=1 Tax=Pseudomonas protegens TaxID=380021 RepID=UPI0037F2BD3D
MELHVFLQAPLLDLVQFRPGNVNTYKTQPLSQILRRKTTHRTNQPVAWTLQDLLTISTPQIVIGQHHDWPVGQVWAENPLTRAVETVAIDYAMRWKIETFHKTLKSGCRAEDSRLRTAERLTNLIAIYCILSWRVFWLTMLSRANPSSDPRKAFTGAEIAVLDQMSTTTAVSERVPYTLSYYTIKLAKLGGYLARKGDPPPGNIVMWRGLTRLTDIVLGMQLSAKLVGN